MNSRSGIRLSTAAGVLLVLCLGLAMSAEPPTAANSGTNEVEPITANKPAEKPSEGDHRISVSAAREQARLMHQVYATTLDVMHHHFFRSDRSVLPARAMEDIFSDVARESGVKARWISVNTKAMSIHHEPRNDFEKKAAAEIAAGKGHFELVEGGFLHRAGAIPLGAGCVGCHNGFFAAPPKSPRFAGLVISIPVSEE